MNIYEKEDAIASIREKIPNFSEEEIVEYTKIAIPNVHKFLRERNEEKISKYCNQDLIQKIKINSSTYRISKSIDNVRVGYARLEGYSSSDDKIYLKVYSSVFFYDDADNNGTYGGSVDRYWNDIWVVTYESIDTINSMNKCPSCGAAMEYNKSKNMFTCDYCRNSIYYSQINWKMVDIEVNGIEYINPELNS